LVTGPARRRGRPATNDVDGGVTTIQSPLIAIPAGGTVPRLCRSRFYFAHATELVGRRLLPGSRSSGATTSKAIEELGSTANDDAAFTTRRGSDISAFAGQSVRIRILGPADAGGAPGLVRGPRSTDVVISTRQ